MIKNLSLLVFAVVSFASAAQAADLCPRYRCVAMADHLMSGDRGNFPGYGYADDLTTAQQDALSDCAQENDGTACAQVTCDKYTGPVLPIFSSCQSQW